MRMNQYTWYMFYCLLTKILLLKKEKYAHFLRLIKILQYLCTRHGKN